MKIVLLRGACDGSRTCPNINVTDRGTYVVQGYTVAERPVPPGEAVMEVPLSLVPELIEAQSRAGISLTDRGTALVQGTQVVDQETLFELGLPAGENAVEIPMSCLAELELTHAR